MTIIDIQKTKEDLIKEQLTIINNINDMIETKAKQASHGAYKVFWENGYVTPKEICDFLGTEAYKLFQEHVNIENWIASKDLNYQKFTIPENWTVEINQDGSVTCTYIDPVILPTE